MIFFWSGDITLNPKGPFKKYVCGLEWGGPIKIVTKCDKGGRGVKPKSDVTTSKKYRFNNYIRMTLKVVITPLHPLFNVALHVNNKVWLENKHILLNRATCLTTTFWDKSSTFNANCLRLTAKLSQQGDIQIQSNLITIGLTLKVLG